MTKIKTFICPVQTIKYYLSKRNNNANHKIKNFSKTHREPFKAAHEDTIYLYYIITMLTIKSKIFPKHIENHLRQLMKILYLVE